MLVCVLVQWLDLVEVLRFDRQLIQQGEVWRLLSAHFTHAGNSHLAMNLAGVLIVMLFFSSYAGVYYWILAIVFISLLTSLGLWVDQQLFWYVGFSGVLHGLFVLGGYHEYQRYKLSGVLLLLVIVLKLLWEQLVGALPGSASLAEGKVAVNAHLYGALAGGLFLGLITLWQRFTASDRSY